MSDTPNGYPVPSEESLNRARSELVTNLNEAPDRVGWCYQDEWWDLLVALAKEANPLVGVEAYIQDENCNYEYDAKAAYLDDGRWIDSERGIVLPDIDGYSIRAFATPRLEKLRAEFRADPSQQFTGFLFDVGPKLMDFRAKGEQFTPETAPRVIAERVIPGFGTVRVRVEVEA